MATTTAADTYRGESLGKKRARLLAHEGALRWQEELSDRAGLYHLALASREAGDASVLNGLGVPSDRVFLLERNAKAYEQARRVSTYGQLVFADVEDAAFDKTLLPRRAFAHVFLDFCGTLTDQAVACAFRVSKMLSAQYSCLSVAVMYGREKRTFERDTAITQTWERRCIVRCRELICALNERAERFNAPLHYGSAGSFIAYHSGRTPMVIVPMCVHRHDETINFCDGAVPAFGKKCGAEQRQEEMSRAAVDGVVRRVRERDVRRTILAAYAENQEKTALLYNVPRATIAAWKAHMTRGTYATAEVKP